jgi:hypothetical protein
MKPATVCNCPTCGAPIDKGHRYNVQFITKPKTEAFSFDGGTARRTRC